MTAAERIAQGEAVLGDLLAAFDRLLEVAREEIAGRGNFERRYQRLLDDLEVQRASIVSMVREAVDPKTTTARATALLNGAERAANNIAEIASEVVEAYDELSFWNRGHQGAFVRLREIVRDTVEATVPGGAVGLGVIGLLVGLYLVVRLMEARP